MVEIMEKELTKQELLAVQVAGNQERLNDLENRVELLEIIAKKETSGVQIDEPELLTKKVIQINAKGKKYFCLTPLEQQVFTENNPGVKTETYSLELPAFVADGYLDDPENKKQFTKRTKKQ